MGGLQTATSDLSTVGLPQPILTRSLLSVTEEARAACIPTWAKEFMGRVHKFIRVQNARGFAGGANITDAMIEAGHFVLMFIMAGRGTATPLIALDDDGRLRFEWENGDKFLTIIVHEKGKYEYFAQLADGNEIEAFSGNRRELSKLLSEVLSA